MQVKVTKRYYKRSRPSQEPVRYTAKQPKGTGTTVHAKIFMDPVLKEHADLRNALLKHETSEIRLWGIGSRGGHRQAVLREPKLIREIGGVSGFWREIRRREKKK